MQMCNMDSCDLASQIRSQPTPYSRRCLANVSADSTGKHLTRSPDSTSNYLFTSPYMDSGPLDIQWHGDTSVSAVLDDRPVPLGTGEANLRWFRGPQSRHRQPNKAVRREICRRNNEQLVDLDVLVPEAPRFPISP